jgi:hypothetical protein
VLVNVATESHIGPGRRWVEFARAWAQLGFRCVRVDQSGLGNSPCRIGQRPDVVFDPHWLDDLPEVIDQLHQPARGDAAPVAMFGLCSGAYSALEAAMRRPVDAVFAVNVRVSLPEMSRGAEVFDARRLVARPLARPLARLAGRHSKLAWGLWRVYRQLAVWHAPMSALVQVMRTGTQLRLIANRKDAEGLREVLWWRLVRGRAARRATGYELRVLPELDHALMTQAAQDAVLQHATSYFTTRYAAALATARPAGSSARVLVLDDPPDLRVAAGRAAAADCGLPGR